MSRWTERILVVVIVLGIAAACDPLATNNTTVTVAAISDLRIPSPSVVQGDVMRDSVGAPAPLSLTAFDSEGRVLVNQPIFVTVLDASIHIDAVGIVHGVQRDTLGARVVAGAGQLQTPQSRIIVSVKPEMATKSPDATTIDFAVDTDSTNNTNWSPPLALTMTDAASTHGAQGFIVSYSVIRSPTPLVATVPTVYIGNDAGKTTDRDTTDVTGTASRRVILRQAAINDPALRAGTKTDTIIIRATALFLGVNVPGTPIDFIVPVKKKP